ncbi:MAG: ABC transporter ATP-binding protein [Verrucomicrobiota bacterium]
MRHLKTIWTFSAPYLRRYWGRLLAGILLGVLFGLSNASFVWATKTLFSRMAGESDTVAISLKTETPKAAAPALGRGTFLEDLKQNVGAKVEAVTDPWLPLRGRPADWQQLLGGFLLLPTLVLLRGMVGYLSSYCMSWVSERVVSDLRMDVLTKLNSLSLDFFNRSTVGDLLTRINHDTATLHRCMIMGFGDLVKEPVTLIFVLTALLLVDAKLTLIAFVFLPICILPAQILGRKARKASKHSVNTTVTQASQLVEAFSSIRIIKAFNLESAQLARYRKLCQDLVHHGMKWVQARELVNPIIETISMCGLGGLIVYIFYTNTTVPELVAFLMGVALCFTPFKKLAAMHVMFQQASVGVERLGQVFNEQPSVKEPANPKPLKDFRDAIVFDHVSFAYRDKLVVENFNYRIPRGFKLGIAGESGSGKSTLVNLLFRFYDPARGAVKIDGIDLREVDVKDLRAQMALVSQEIVLFDQTIGENIACGKPGATRAGIEAAARAANAHDFIMQQPQGYDTRIGERGVLLSGGQRQRLCIARAVVRGAPILVMDEATASLDSQAEAEVQAALDQLTEGHTVICVAHRLSTLANMDEIVVLSEGRIVEQGKFHQLLQQGGKFAAMAAYQGIRAD